MAYVKVLATSDVASAFHRFGGSDAHRILHNLFVAKYEVEREKLERAEKWEDVLRQQGRVAAVRESLILLHQNDTADVRDMFQIPK